MKGFQNNKIRDKPFPSFEDILERLTSEEIFSNYIPNLVLNGKMSSPLGETDRHASFSVYWSYRYNKYLFKEHRYGWFGDIFDFVKLFYGLNSLNHVCMQICMDFGIEDYYIDKSVLKYSIYSGNKKVKTNKAYRRKVRLEVTIRDWNKEDLAFWLQFGITLEWLKYANIHPIQYYFIEGNIKIPHKLSYVYVENKDGLQTYKIYQPLAEPSKKWLSNNNSSIWELWRMLPESHDFLIITKSRKDALSVMATMGLPSTSLQAEGTIPKEVVIDELKSRFKYIFLLYDNDFDKKDNYGRLYGAKLSELFNLPQIELPEIYGEKDYSDLVRKYEPYKASKILWRIIKRELLKQFRER